MLTRIGSGTRSPSNSSCRGYPLKACPSCKATKACELPRNTTHQGLGLARNNLRRTSPTHGGVTQWFRLFHEVPAGYTRTRLAVSPSLHGGNLGGAGGNRTHA